MQYALPSNPTEEIDGIPSAAEGSDLPGAKTCETPFPQKKEYHISHIQLGPPATGLTPLCRVVFLLMHLRPRTICSSPCICLHSLIRE